MKFNKILLTILIILTPFSSFAENGKGFILIQSHQTGMTILKSKAQLNLEEAKQKVQNAKINAQLDSGEAKTNAQNKLD